MDEKRYFLFANPYKADTIIAAGEFAALLIAQGCAVSLDGWLYDQLKVGERSELLHIPSHTKAIIAFGGDGTLLRIVPTAAAKNIPLLGVNMGHTGFLLEADPDKLGNVASRLIRKDYHLETRMMMRCELDDGFSALLMNEVVVSRGENPGSINISAYSDEELIYSSHGDGILVASATGTTGYALSAGGPVVHPELQSLSVVPICSHDLHLRPVVLPVSKTIRLHVHAAHSSKHQISIDGQVVLCRQGDTRITINKADEQVQFIRLSHQGFITRLYHKQRDWTQQINGGGA